MLYRSKIDSVYLAIERAVPVLQGMVGSDRLSYIAAWEGGNIKSIKAEVPRKLELTEQQRYRVGLFEEAINNEFRKLRKA